MERRLLALSDAEFRAFVAALWEASGWTVERAGAELVVTREGERRRLLVLSPRRIAPGLRRAPERPDEPPAGDDGDAIDLVVSPYRTTDPSGLPRGLPDASILGAAELRERLWYAIDVEDRDRLLREYLGIDPAAPAGRTGLTPLPPLRLPTTRHAAAGAVGVALVVAGLLVLVTASGVLDAGSSGGENATEVQGEGEVLLATSPGYDVSQTCERGPEEVVAVGAAAVRGPQLGRGLVTIGRFWDPTMVAGLPDGSWSDMMRRDELRAFYEAPSVEFSEPVVEGDTARVEAVASTDDGSERFAFELVRRDTSVGEGCWMIQTLDPA